VQVLDSGVERLGAAGGEIVRVTSNATAWISGSRRFISGEKLASKAPIPTATDGLISIRRSK
jgi:hypothetical protein